VPQPPLSANHGTQERPEVINITVPNEPYLPSEGRNKNETNQGPACSWSEDTASVPLLKAQPKSTLHIIPASYKSRRVIEERQKT
jgi:hypothetical protein